MFKLIALFLFISFICSAQTYYIDSISGKDTYVGTSTLKPWKTIKKVNSMPPKAGDFYLFKKGGSWKETLNVFYSGTEAQPIIYGAYGTGAAPILNGEYLRETSINIYLAKNIIIQDMSIINTGVNQGPAISLLGTTYVQLKRLELANNKGYGAIMLAADETSGGGNNNLIQDCSIHNTTGTATTIANRNYGVGIFAWGSDKKSTITNNQIIRNTIYKNGTGTNFYNAANNLFQGNIIYQNEDHGINFAGTYVESNMIERNTVYENAQKRDDTCGINLFRVGNNNTVRYNTIYREHDTFNDGNIQANPGYPNKYGSCGIRFDGGDPSLGVGNDFVGDKTGNKIYYNKIYDEYIGIEDFNFANIEVYNNVFYNSTFLGIEFSSYNTNNYPISGSKFKNNIVSGSKKYHIFVPDATLKLMEISNNTYYPDGLDKFVYNQSLQTTNFSNWKTLTNYDTFSSFLTDPLFITPYDFHLQTTSPCMKTGIYVGIDKDFDGNIVLLNVEQGVYEY